MPLGLMAGRPFNPFSRCYLLTLLAFIRSNSVILAINSLATSSFKWPRRQAIEVFRWVHT